MTAPLEEGEVPNVLLSIHPEHAEAILDGSKLWEYRRVIPAVDPPIRLVLYATDPIQAAVGSCWVPFIKSGWPSTVVLETVDETPNDPREVASYLSGLQEAHALRVVGPRRFDEPVERSSLEAAGRPPSQNFRYLPGINPAYAEKAGVTV